MVVLEHLFLNLKSSFDTCKNIQKSLKTTTLFKRCINYHSLYLQLDLIKKIKTQQKIKIIIKEKGKGRSLKSKKH